jgi:hypothetical protein
LFWDGPAEKQQGKLLENRGKHFKQTKMKSTFYVAEFLNNFTYEMQTFCRLFETLNEPKVSSFKKSLFAVPKQQAKLLN